MKHFVNVCEQNLFGSTVLVYVAEWTKKLSAILSGKRRTANIAVNSKDGRIILRSKFVLVNSPNQIYAQNYI